MKVSQLKRKVVIQAIITAIVLTLSTVLYYQLQSYEASLNLSLIHTKNEATSIKSRIVNFQRKELEYDEAKKLWANLSDSQKKRSGIVLASAQQLLENLRNQYSLGGFKADISKPVDLQDVYRTETTVVASTKVELSFDALNDESVFAFIGALSRGLPGYIKISSLQVTREGEITPVLLKNLQEGKYQPVVRGRMAFYWRDLKDVSAGDTKGEEG